MQKSLAEIAYLSAKDELTDSIVYNRLSKPSLAKSEKFSKTLQSLASMEHGHYAFWKKFCPGREIEVNAFTVRWIIFLRRLFGITFAVKYLERNEVKTIKSYRSYSNSIPAEDKMRFDQMVADEEQHEQEFANQFDEPHVKYISFVVLGLADALVEIAGIHAGSLGIYDKTELAGLAGIVAGAAASIAMASAAYAQAKTGFKGSPTMGAIYTGTSYFVTAVILATPYFITKVMLNALLSSLIAGVVLILFISFYGSVIAGTVFRKDFVEVTSIMFGATLTLYLFGTIIRYLTGMTIS
jgi:VIT1/CCC1 family predicted Fe2+/Mn2+ transporter